MIITMEKVKIATVWLSGCAGCHMSFLNLDEALIDLARKVEVVKSPIVDMKGFPPCDVGLVEGAVSDEENLSVLKSLRESCKVLIAMGDCAVFGGITSFRNLFDTEEVLARGFVETETTSDGKIPNDPHVPKLLEQAMGLDAHVRVDYFLPGCPPHPEAILHMLTSILDGTDPKLPRELLHFDSRIAARRQST